MHYKQGAYFRGGLLSEGAYYLDYTVYVQKINPIMW